jgi:biopolymer transport protein ExbD
MDQKSAVINLYLGEGGAIQIDNELVTLQGIVPYINQVRKGLSLENQERLTISLKADKKTPMGLLADVKRELQKAYAVKVNYAGSMEK